MATPNPALEISEEISALLSRVNSLQGSVQLPRRREAVEQIQTNVNGMAERLLNLQTCSYVFEKDLEGQAQSLVGTWLQLNPNLQAPISSQSAALVNALRPLEM